MSTATIKRGWRTKEEIALTAGIMPQWRKALGILGKRGALFAVIQKGSKLPTRKGWNQTENGIDAEQAKKHLAAGDNITLLAGTGTPLYIYAFDMDADAERGHECAQLGGGLYFYRDNAPQKAKFIFSCPDPIPTRLKSRSHGIDLLGLNSNGTHWSCVIAGTHSSGAPIKWGGHTIPTLAADTVAALWEEWIGEELFPSNNNAARECNPTYTNADLARLADALEHVEPNDMDYNAWVGKIGAIHDAFDGSDEALEVAIDWADGKPGEVEQKWKSFDREYTGVPATLDSIFYLARKGGWQDTWLQERLAEYRAWLAAPNAIEGLKVAGFKNPERARKLLDTILQKCEGKKQIRITPGYAHLARESGIAKGGIGGYLARLYTGGFINLHLGTEGNSTVIELVFHNLNTYTPTGEGVQVVKNWNVYREYRADEVFLNGHAAYTRTHPRPSLRPFGDNGLGALLALLDGPATIKEAAELIGYSYDAMARVFRRLVDRGVVVVDVGERNRKTYVLLDEWRDIIEADRKHMTTYGVRLFRDVDALKSRVTYLRRRGQEDRAQVVEKEFKRLDDIASNLRVNAGITACGRPVTKREAKLRRLKQAQVIGDRALYRPPFHTQTDEETLVDAMLQVDGHHRLKYALDRRGAQNDWGELNAWASMVHGPNWWLALDQEGVIKEYHSYRIAQQPPTIHFDEVAA